MLAFSQSDNREALQKSCHYVLQVSIENGFTTKIKVVSLDRLYGKV